MDTDSVYAMKRCHSQKRIFPVSCIYPHPIVSAPYPENRQNPPQTGSSAQSIAAGPNHSSADAYQILHKPNTHSFTTNTSIMYISESVSSGLIRAGGGRCTNHRSFNDLWIIGQSKELPIDGFVKRIRFGFTLPQTNTTSTTDRHHPTIITH